MSLFTALLWSGIGLGIGLLVFLAVPVLIGPGLPRPIAERLANYYDRLAMKTTGRALLVRRQIGAYDIIPSRYDGEKESETVDIGGERHDFVDELGLMGTWHNKPFGIALEGLGVILDPLLATLASYEIDRAESNEWVETAEDGSIQRYINEMPVPDKHTLAEIREAAAIIPGDRGSKDLETTERYFELSQSMFSSSVPKQTMIVLLALSAGFGLYIILQMVGGAGGAPPVENPVNIPA